MLRSLLTSETIFSLPFQIRATCSSPCWQVRLRAWRRLSFLDSDGEELRKYLSSQPPLTYLFISFIPLSFQMMLKHHTKAEEESEASIQGETKHDWKLYLLSPHKVESFYHKVSIRHPEQRFETVPPKS